MSFFLLAVEPPALIDPAIPTETVSESHLAQVSPENPPNSRNLTIIHPPIERRSPQSSIPLPVIPPSEITEVKPVLPTVGTPLPSRGDQLSELEIPPLPSTREGADALGKPLSIQDSHPSIQIHAATEIVSGLQRKTLTPKGKVATVLVRKKGEKTAREFQIPLDNPLVQAIDPTTEKPLELIADEQEFDEDSRVITARGNVTLRFDNSVLTADRLQINLPEKLAVAEGRVILTRGDQILRGDRFEYYFVQDSGTIYNANGEIFQPSAGRDFGQTLPTDASANSFGTLNDRLAVNQPLQRVSTGEGFTFAVGGQNPSGRNNQGTGTARGTINRIRFQAERLDFDGKVWNASNVRLTNDPFSPPELEVRADTATFRSTGPFTDELSLGNSQVVFDQRITAPTFVNTLVFDRRRRRPNSIGFGYDGEDRGGFFIESSQIIAETPNFLFELTPQYLIQKVINPDAFPSANPGGGDVSPFSPKAFGLLGNVEATLSPRTIFQARASFSSLDLGELENSVRSKIRIQQRIGVLENPYLLNAEYNYRERLFNGSLGFQTVNQSIGAILTSPVYYLGSSGVGLSFQTSLQNIDAPTDQSDLLPANSTDNVANLSRFQGAVSLNKSFLLWAGATLPPSPASGLRYSPVPVQPYLSLFTGLTGVSSYYTNGETQNTLTATIGLLGQVGYFSRPVFDYTGFNLSFSQGLRDGQSPFFFDRFVDQQIVSFGITQQLYGPIRIGFQSSYSIDESKEISTDYFIEWSRRTYSLLLRYNPILQLGTLNIRVSDFNWTGNPGYFEGSDVRPVIDGVTR
jgi:lipopolysaccharide export system protein LptA